MNILFFLLPFIYLGSISILGIHFKIFTKQVNSELNEFGRYFWIDTITYTILEVLCIIISFSI